VGFINPKQKKESIMSSFKCSDCSYKAMSESSLLHHQVSEHFKKRNDDDRWKGWTKEEQDIVTQQWALARIDKPLEDSLILWNFVVNKYSSSHYHEKFSSQKAFSCSEMYTSIINDNQPKVIERVVEKIVPIQVTINDKPIVQQVQINIEPKRPLLKVDVLGVYPGDEFELIKKYEDKIDLRFIPVKRKNIGVRNSVDFVISTRNRGHHNYDRILIALKNDKRKFIDLVHRNGAFHNLVDEALSELLAKQVQ